MITLNELNNKILTLRTVLGELEVKGRKNAEIIVGIDNLCASILKDISDSVSELQENQNGSKSESDKEESDQ